MLAAVTDAPTPPPRGIVERVKYEFGRREFLRHFTTLVSGTALAQVVQIPAMLVVARLVTAAEFGVYVAIIAVVSTVMPLAALRYDMAIVLPKRDDEARALLRVCTVLNTIVCSVMTVAMIWLAGPLARWLNAPESVGWMFAAGPITWLMAQVSILGYYLTRTKNYATISQNKVLNALSLSGLQIGGGAAGLGTSGLMIATVVAQTLTLTNLLRRTRGQYAYEGTPPSRRALMREYRKMPLLNLPNNAVDSVRQNGITLLITAGFGQAITGQFGMAWRMLSAPMGLINSAVSQIFFQKLAVTKRGAMFRLVRTTLLRSLALGIVPFGLLYLVSPWLLPWVLGGDQWRQAGHLARALTPWLFLNFITSPISTVFVVVRRQGLMLAFAIVYCAVPLSLLWYAPFSIVPLITAMAWAMAGLLVVFTVLALWVAHAFDHGRGGAADAEDERAAEVEAAEEISEEESGTPTSSSPGGV